MKIIEIIIINLIFFENLLHAQCQCFMIESEAWNVSLNLFEGDSEKVTFQISSEGVEGR